MSEDQRLEGADLKFEAGGAVSTGPASGNGFEILLQGFNWDSSKHGVIHSLRLFWPMVLSELVQTYRFPGTRFCKGGIYIHLVASTQRFCFISSIQTVTKRERLFPRGIYREIFTI